MVRIARRNSVNKHALVVRIDGRSRYRTTQGFVRSSGVVQSSPCFSVSHHIALSLRRMVIFFLVSSKVSRHPQSLVRVRVLIPLRSTLRHSLSPRIPVSFASCVLSRSFSLYCLWWDNFVSYPSLVVLTTNILTKDGALVSLTLASPLVSNGIHKRACLVFECRIDGEVSILRNVPPPLYLLRCFEQPVPAVAKGTWTAVPYQPSETATAVSTPKPVKQLGTDPKQGTGTVLEPSPALPFGAESSSANAGVALASHGSGLAMTLTGFLVTVLAFDL